LNIPADYVDVAERIRIFKETYPEGSLQGESQGLVTVGERSFIVYRARAYRTPDDPTPGIGWAWEPVPGPTPFTKDSELMNAETSAWGRAIVALGIPTKKVASAEEVRNRQDNGAASDPGSDVPPELSAEPNPTQVLRGQLTVILKRLNEQAPRPEGFASWADELQSWCYSETGKTDSHELTEGELRLLVTHANGLLKDEGLETV
jgi:hypothetical protein